MITSIVITSFQISVFMFIINDRYLVICYDFAKADVK